MAFRQRDMRDELGACADHLVVARTRVAAMRELQRPHTMPSEPVMHGFMHLDQRGRIVALLQALILAVTAERA